MVDFLQKSSVLTLFLLRQEIWYCQRHQESLKKIPSSFVSAAMCYNTFLDPKYQSIEDATHKNLMLTCFGCSRISKGLSLLILRRPKIGILDKICTPQHCPCWHLLHSLDKGYLSRVVTYFDFIFWLIAISGINYVSTVISQKERRCHIPWNYIWFILECFLAFVFIVTHVKLALF